MVICSINSSLFCSFLLTFISAVHFTAYVIMENSFNSVSEIVPGLKDGWKIKVRILRLWEVPAFLKPNQANSIEMVLIDERLIFFFCELLFFIFMVVFFIFRSHFLGLQDSCQCKESAVVCF